jgi:hypothetical protein
MRGACALAAAALLAASAVGADTASEVRELTGRLLGPTPAMKDLDELTDSIGGRISGTPACAKAEDWAATKFRSAGVASVRLEAFTLPTGWAPGAAEAACLAPAAFPVRIAAAPGTGSTPGGAPIEAALVDAGSGTPEEFARLGAAASGAVALLHNPEMKSFDDLFAEYMKCTPIVEAARKAGVAAVLIESSRPRGLLYRHAMTFDASVVPLPVAIVAREQAERLARLAAEGPVKVRVAIENTAKPAAPARNVVAEIPGTDRKDEIVLVGAHLDSWDLGTGANDNGVSCAQVIDVARQIAAAGLKPRRTIRFVLFTGEEQGMIGSRAYVAAHATEIGRHVAAVIYDTGSGKLLGTYLNGREDLRPAVDAALGRVASLGPFTNAIDALDGTDNFYFLLEGVPTIIGMQDPAPYLPDYHAESDTYDKVDARETKAGEAALAALVWEFASRDARPAPRQSRAEVEALLKATHLDDQMKAFGQWEGWVASAPR